MSKKFKSQASSSRAASTFGSFGGFSSSFSGLGREPSSLTYVAEPPDLSQIYEAQLAIAFKNFLKKDEVTRTKALDDLRDHVSTVESRNGTLDDGFLEAWVKIYPRASIDLSRRVRQTAHSTQGSIASLVGKRIARFLPKVIGAWLAGLYDNDRMVHRSAFESFTRVFSTEEKRNSVWKIYQSSILDFVDDVILQQTPQTLSDERTVKSDDAEAKYARVVGTAVLLFNRIIGSSTREVLEKDIATVENLLGSKSLWSLCYHDDPFVRRSVYVLLRSAVSKDPEQLDWKLISAAIIGKSLHVSQLGSSSDLSELLLQVTAARPQLWTDDYTGKSSSSKRLIQYIEKGSEGGLASFWQNLYELLQVIPSQTLVKVDVKSTNEDSVELSSATKLTQSFQNGLNSRDEPRQNRAVGWKAYIDTGMWLANKLPQNDRESFLHERLSPLIMQYVKPEQDRSEWELPAQSAEALCADYLDILATHNYDGELHKLWTELSDNLLEAVKLSSPEQSKDFRSSQDAVGAQAERLLGLEASVLSRVADTDRESKLLQAFKDTNLGLLGNCLEVLQTRNGKPYGAAAVVEGMVQKVAQIAQQSQELLRFVQDDAPELLFSPSADRLISIILSCRSWDGFGPSFEKVVERVAQSEPESSNAHAVQKLLSTLDFKEVDERSGLGSLIARALDRACRGSSLHWSIVIAVLQNQTSHGELTESIFLSIIDALSDESKMFDTLHGVSQIATTVPTALREFQTGPHGSKLTGKLLFLAESPSEEVAGLAESLTRKVKESAVSETSARSTFEILQHNFNNVNEESLSIGSLLNVAEEFLHNTKPEDLKKVVKDILPSRQNWEDALEPFLALPPRLSTAITSPLKGTVHIIDRHISDESRRRYETVPRDSSHCSSALRLAYFTIRTLSSLDITSQLGVEELQTLFFYLPLAVQLIDDDLSIDNCNGITGVLLLEQREDYMEIVNDGRSLINRWAHLEESVAPSITAFWESKLESLTGTSPADYRVGEAFVKIMEGQDSANSKSSEEVAKLCKDVRTANAIRSASWVAILRQSILSNPAGTRLCNELVAESTGLKPHDERKDGLRKLSLLNLLVVGLEEVIESIPTQRVVFLVKHLVQCLQSENISLSVKAEVFQTLSFALPCIHEMYGSHWEDCMDALSTTWREASGSDEALPVLLGSFRLFACLRSIVGNEDSNDDVKDTWSDRKAGLFNDLTATIKEFDSSITFYQPRDVTVDLLCRLINSISIETLEDVSRIFPLLTAQSRAVQRAAYTVLHRYIPSVQEQVSFDVALSKTAVKLPDELLSLLLEAPTMDSISLSYGDDKVWADIRSYLLSWKIIFDHFVNASFAVQENYVSSIKENDVLIPLLEFTFDFLQQSHQKMVDASKFDIRSFELDQSDSQEKEIQWLLVHLYFLCLKYLANMTKSWWIDAKKRTKGPVEAWTEKYISPLIIADALQGITEWISTQDPNEDRALTVKISPKTSEIIASIPVDEESPPVALSISLPPAYPLQPALVVGRSRVLVDERKWKSWLLTIQGVIMFANGNIVDGLLAFRKNVQGALKGQSECAICYSVISTDMQTPNKRCATCKNTFHSVCLFRWFKSSNQSTCPLCRNNFVYV
ncbi:hypothetical protein AFCA_007199 [Aspergillus flavus]|uniref:E3 ubiquitin-protein ligase listerin n=1 Tax=Aspergillus flavus TaxID=5059 RepID=A0AB74CKI1_ASPFL|nr:hypothetical protein G4B11_006349 [Aspergillus flavus]RMZ47228.1 RING zinc finger protein [Aspergillus flavus]UDD59773.1 hypothetical protein AFCA_007199 [Aspergillus flavus]